MIMDKIKVNLNYKLYHLLIRDMEDFLFYKENKEINKNLFYNTIVIRMYERIIKQYQQKSAQTQEILNKYHIHNLKLRDELVEVSNLLYPIHEDSNVYNESILFRPNKQFLPIFEEIEEKTALDSYKSEKTPFTMSIHTFLSLDDFEQELIKCNELSEIEDLEDSH